MFNYPFLTLKERDNETGLDFFEARYYSSSQGRFSSPDPFGGSVGNPQSFNHYAYALSNPCNLVDPTGMSVEHSDFDRPLPPIRGGHPCRKEGCLGLYDGPQSGKLIDAHLVTIDDPTYNPYGSLFKDPIDVSPSAPDPIASNTGEMATSILMRPIAALSGVPRDPEGDDWVSRYVSDPRRTGAAVVSWASQGARDVGYALLPDYVSGGFSLPLMAAGQVSLSKDLHLYGSFHVLGITGGNYANTKNWKAGFQFSAAYFFTTKMTTAQRDAAIKGPAINVTTGVVGGYFSLQGGPPAVTVGLPSSFGVNVSTTGRIF